MQAHEIVRLAKEASFDWDGFSLPDRMAIYHFAELVAAHEREECAKVCEDNYECSALECAELIRQRGEQ